MAAVTTYVQALIRVYPAYRVSRCRLICEMSRGARDDHRSAIRGLTMEPAACEPRFEDLFGYLMPQTDPVNLFLTLW
ncbi:hypothetical protein DNTS_022908 [Danionella cerebrum]|uniref:Uncharacterized protein n=1 Tax=Danionella cerebrum TaxID=2873325 RepID=A0A553QH66_9TELE|nr:hypothetical protein DNTS_022908 [Danionella translucida]